MEAEYGLSRSSINMRLEPRLQSPVVHALKAQERVRIVGESGDMLEIESTRWRPPLRGFAARSSIVRSSARPAVFPQIDLGGGFTIPSVPISLPLAAFRRWLDSAEESPWLPAGYAESIRSGKLPSVGRLIRRAIEQHRPAWNAWVAEVERAERPRSCTLDEWVALLQGGRDMWSIRAERLFTDPSQHSATLGWVVPEDIVRWTGRVRINEKEPKYSTWYEVELTKADKQLIGWYKAALLDEFFAPTPLTDLGIPDNRTRIFDLARTHLRLPADPEIDDSRKAGRAGAQFIDVGRALGWGQLHHNLCGEFCAAALASTDVIPLLQKWLPAYPRAREILAEDSGTSIPDLEAMLTTFRLKYEFYRAYGSTSPITPTYIRRKLDAGLMAIVFTGVTPYGAVKSRSPIRHWVVVEDLLRVADSGWLRVYNPFSNREETCRFDEVYDLPSRDSIGLWVEPVRPSGTEAIAVELASVPYQTPSLFEPALA